MPDSDPFDPWATAVAAGGGTAPTKKQAKPKQEAWGSFKAGEAAPLNEEDATKPGKQGGGKKNKKNKEGNKKVGPTGPNLARRRVTEARMGGLVEAWSNSYGWIRPFQHVNHPKGHKHGGKVYIHGKDVLGGLGFLPVGAAVEFYVFEDDAGLGAEECSVVETKGKGGKGKFGWDGGKGGWDAGKSGWDAGKGGWDVCKGGWDAGKGGWDAGKGGKGGPGMGFGFGGKGGKDGTKGFAGWGGFGDWGKNGGKDAGKGSFMGGYGKEGKGWSGEGDLGGKGKEAGRGKHGAGKGSGFKGAQSQEVHSEATQDWASYAGPGASGKGSKSSGLCGAPIGSKGSAGGKASQAPKQETRSVATSQSTGASFAVISRPAKGPAANQGTAACSGRPAVGGNSSAGPCMSPYMMGNVGNQPPMPASMGNLPMNPVFQFGGIMPGMAVTPGMGGAGNMPMNTGAMGIGVFPGNVPASGGMGMNAGTGMLGSTDSAAAGTPWPWNSL